MGQTAAATTMTMGERQSVRHAAKYFIAPEIYQRHDIGVRQIDLVRIVSTEIVPRLLRIHNEVAPDLCPVELLRNSFHPDAADVADLAAIVLGEDLDAAAAYIALLRERGLDMETLYLELLEPTARHLGTMWDNDQCDFIDVTIGVGRLQALLAIFNETHVLPQIGDRRIVFMATAPGNQHSFGASMIERLLTAAGWQVEANFSGSAEEIVSTVRDDWFAVVGLAAGSTGDLYALKSTIVRVRAESRNPTIGVMVGGPMFTANPSLATDMGADATAPNAPTAVLAAQKLFDLGVRGRLGAG